MFWESRKNNFSVEVFTELTHESFFIKYAQWAVTSGHAVKDTTAFDHNIYVSAICETLKMKPQFCKGHLLVSFQLSKMLSATSKNWILEIFKCDVWRSV